MKKWAAWAAAVGMAGTLSMIAGPAFAATGPTTVTPETVTAGMTSVDVSIGGNFGVPYQPPATLNFEFEHPVGNSSGGSGTFVIYGNATGTEIGASDVYQVPIPSSLIQYMSGKNAPTSLTMQVATSGNFSNKSQSGILATYASFLIDQLPEVGLAALFPLGILGVFLITRKRRTVQ